jgi:predicted transcriptional regulator
MARSLSESIKSLTEHAQALQSEEVQRNLYADPHRAIREKSVVCLECDRPFRALTKKHLATHNMTPSEYREKWGYKKGTALVAKSLARARRKKMLEMQLWKRKKDYL